MLPNCPLGAVIRLKSTLEDSVGGEGLGESLWIKTRYSSRNAPIYNERETVKTVIRPSL